MQIQGTDHVELYVGNALQSAHFYRTVLGFQIEAYAGPETGLRDRMSYVVRQGSAALVLTSPVDSHSPVADHLHRHADGVRDIALAVPDARLAFATAVNNGAIPFKEPQVLEDETSRVTVAAIKTFGDTIHTFVERKGDRGAFLAHYRSLSPMPRPNADLKAIDHFAVAVKPGDTGRWARFYMEVFGFDLSLEEYTETGYSSMNSKVVTSPDRSLCLVFVEPGSGVRKSPIEEYLSFYGDSGVHHIALSSEHIIRSVRVLRENGLQFTYTPPTYYDALISRVGRIAERVNDLKQLGILVDREERGYLLQIFSQPIQSRPTFFFEIIQRAGAEGFGSGNIKALFEAIERAQILRGNS